MSGDESGKCFGPVRHAFALAALFLFIPGCHYSRELGELAGESDGGADASDAGCVPLTCEGRCGAQVDGCGGLLSCAECPEKASCNNAKQDGDETGVDCGGSCAGCPPSGACAKHDDCGPNASCVGGVCMKGRWSTRFPMPTPRRGAAAVAVPNGDIYVLGGSAPGGITAAVEIYSPATDRWTAGTPMLEKRTELVALMGGDGRLYAIAGARGQGGVPGSSVTAEVYDFGLDRWARLPNLPEVHEGATGAALSGGRIAVIGGTGWTAEGPFDTVLTWKPGATGWTPLTGRMLNGRFDHGLAQLKDGRLFAFGGSDESLRNTQRSEIWSPQTEKWSSEPAMPLFRMAFATAVGTNGLVYVVGGQRGPELAEVTETYNPETRAWGAAPNLSVPRTFLAATATKDGRIWTFGGLRDGQYSDVVEVFEP